MPCPIDSDIPNDASVIGKQHKEVILIGVIRAVGLKTRPYKNYHTVTLYPDRGTVKYLKFRSEDELKKWDFTSGKRMKCEGCLHEIDNKDVVFDITNVEFL